MLTATNVRLNDAPVHRYGSNNVIATDVRRPEHEVFKVTKPTLSSCKECRWFLCALYVCFVRVLSLYV